MTTKELEEIIAEDESSIKSGLIPAGLVPKVQATIDTNKIKLAEMKAAPPPPEKKRKSVFKVNGKTIDLSKEKFPEDHPLMILDTDSSQFKEALKEYVAEKFPPKPKAAKKPAAPKPKEKIKISAPPKIEKPKPGDPNCEELLEKYNARKKSAKKSSVKTKNATPTEKAGNKTTGAVRIVVKSKKEAGKKDPEAAAENAVEKMLRLIEQGFRDSKKISPEMAKEAIAIVKSILKKSFEEGGSIDPEFAAGGRTGGNFKFNIGDSVMVNDSGYIRKFEGFDVTKPAKILDRSKVKSSGKTYYFYKLELANGDHPFNNAQESTLTLAEATLPV